MQPGQLSGWEFERGRRCENTGEVVVVVDYQQHRVIAAPTSLCGARPPLEALRDFVDRHRQAYGVESICKVLQIAPSGYWRHAALQCVPHGRCARVQRDETLIPCIQRVWHATLQVYGADKVWQQMSRESLPVARCTVEQLMRRLGLSGVNR